MEESLAGRLRREFGAEEVDIRTYSPLTLAFVGDGIYDLLIRTILVQKGNKAANHLHKEKSDIVKAETQAAMGQLLYPLLTSEEQSVYRRGRNAKSYTTAKNASVSDYRKATALEALFGYLYLKEDMVRLLSLVKNGLGLMGLVSIDTEGEV